MQLPFALSFGAMIAFCDDVDDVIVIVPFVTVEIVADALVGIVSAALVLCASSAFDAADLSSFVMLAVLFVRIFDGVALYESEVIAASGFGGG